MPFRGTVCPSWVVAALQGYSVPFRGTVCPSGVVQPRTRGGSATDSAFAFGVRNTPVCGGGLCGRRLFSRGFNPTAIPTLNGTTYVCGDWRALVLPSPWLVAHCAGTRLATPLPLWERGFVVGWADAATPLPPSPHPIRGEGPGRWWGWRLLPCPQALPEYWHRSLKSCLSPVRSLCLCVSCSVLSLVRSLRLCVSAATPFLVSLAVACGVRRRVLSLWTIMGAGAGWPRRMIAGGEGAR